MLKVYFNKFLANTNLTSRLQELLNIRISDIDSKQASNNNSISTKNLNIVVSKTMSNNNDKTTSSNNKNDKSSSFSNIDDTSVLTNSSFYDTGTSQLLSYQFGDTSYTLIVFYNTLSSLFQVIICLQCWKWQEVVLQQIL